MSEFAYVSVCVCVYAVFCVHLSENSTDHGVTGKMQRKPIKIKLPSYVTDILYILSRTEFTYCHGQKKLLSTKFRKIFSYEI